MAWLCHTVQEYFPPQILATQPTTNFEIPAKAEFGNLELNTAWQACLRRRRDCAISLGLQSS